MRKASDPDKMLTSSISGGIDSASKHLDKNSSNGDSRTNSFFGSQKLPLITKEEFILLDPESEIEIFVVRPVKKIVALLSHVEYLFELKLKGGLYKYKVNKRFRDFDSLNQVVSVLLVDQFVVKTEISEPFLPRNPLKVLDI